MTEAKPFGEIAAKIVEDLRPPKCDHDYQRTPYRVGMCIIYECTKCGDEYEKDVS